MREYRKKKINVLWEVLKKYTFTFFQEKQMYNMKTGTKEMYMTMLVMSFDDSIAEIKNEW